MRQNIQIQAIEDIVKLLHEKGNSGLQEKVLSVLWDALEQGNYILCVSGVWSLRGKLHRFGNHKNLSVEVMWGDESDMREFVD